MKTLRKLEFAFAVVVASTALVGSAQARVQAGSDATPGSAEAAAEALLIKKGAVAPDFLLHDDSGKAVKLSAYKGKVVVLDFWATWCGPCQDSLPRTNALAAKFGKKHVVFLGLNVWDDKKAFHNWLPQHKNFSSIKFAIDTHPQGEDVATKLYHVSGIPTQYIVDRKGKIVKGLIGDSEDENELSNAIKSALAK